MLTSSVPRNVEHSTCNIYGRTDKLIFRGRFTPKNIKTEDPTVYLKTLWSIIDSDVLNKPDVPDEYSALLLALGLVVPVVVGQGTAGQAKPALLGYNIVSNEGIKAYLS